MRSKLRLYPENAGVGLDHMSAADKLALAMITDPNTISARVYRGTPLLGRTEILIRDLPLGSDAHCG
jgi:hypothetical protein